MLLSVYERLLILNVLPREGSLVDLRVVRDLKGSLSFSEEEQAALEITQDAGGHVKWRAEADHPVEIPVGPRAAALIRKSFKRLDDAEKLTQEHLPVYERFLDEEKKDQ